MRGLAAAGLGIAAVMPFVFFASGFERGGLYVALQLLGVIALVAGAWGILRGGRDGRVVLAVALGWSALSRLLHVVFDLTRLPASLNWLLVAAWTAAAVSAALVAAHPTPGRVAGLRASLWGLSFFVFLAAFRALHGGALTGVLGLTLGMVGLSLVAANVEREESGPTAVTG